MSIIKLSVPSIFLSAGGKDGRERLPRMENLRGFRQEIFSVLPFAASDMLDISRRI